MRRAPAAVVLAFVLAAAGLAAAGDLQVTCPPGHRVYLDDTFAGLTTTDQDGLYLRGVPAGPHTVRVEKLGFVPVERTVDIPETGAVEIQVLHLDATPEEEPAPVEPVHDTPPPAPEQRVGTEPEATAPVESAPPAAGPAESPEPETVREPKAGASAAPPVPAETSEVTGGTGAVAAAAAAAPPPQPPPGESAPGARSAPAPAAGAAAQQGGTPAENPESPEAVLQRSPKQVADVMFGYRARGAGLEHGGTVTLSRERGGPRAPTMVFWCVGKPECVERTRPDFEPGPYRFRATCRAEGEQQQAVDAFAELQAKPGMGYLLDVTYKGPGESGCFIEIHEVGAPTP